MRRTSPSERPLKKARKGDLFALTAPLVPHAESIESQCFVLFEFLYYLQGIVYPVLPFIAPCCSLQSVFIKNEKNMNPVKWGYIDARFSFVADMNADGAFTISDIWEWFKWVYFAPGDLIAIFLLDTSIGNFLEVSWESLSGTGSGVVSLVLWLFLLGILLVALDG